MIMRFYTVYFVSTKKEAVFSKIWETLTSESVLFDQLHVNFEIFASRM